MTIQYIEAEPAGMILKKINPLLLLIVSSLYAQPFTGCVSIRKYPSSWPGRNNVTRASQLSGIYHPELLQILGEYIDVPYVSDTGPFKVELLLNDSLQYQIKLVPATTNTLDTVMDHPRNIDNRSKEGFTIKKKITNEGLRFAYNPYEGTGGQGRPIASNYYIILNKDKQGNLVIKHGQEAYAIVMLIPTITEEYEWISLRKDAVIYPKHRLKKKL